MIRKALLLGHGIWNVRNVNSSSEVAKPLSFVKADLFLVLLVLVVFAFICVNYGFYLRRFQGLECGLFEEVFV